MNEETIEKAANILYEDNTFAYNGFISGANWRINSVWHDKEEIPQKCRMCLVELTMSRDHKVYRLWNGGWDNPYMTKWAYVDDLLPDGKEE